MDPKLKLWQQLASTDVIADVYAMYEYVNFLCFWPTYTASFSEGKDYLYPADAKRFYQTDGAQYNYGYKDGYFDGLVAKIESVSKTDFTALIENIRAAEAIATKAIADIESENYSVVNEYSGVFKDGRNQYKMNAADELGAEMQNTYKAFAEWLATWEI